MDIKSKNAKLAAGVTVSDTSENCKCFRFFGEAAKVLP